MNFCVVGKTFYSGLCGVLLLLVVGCASRPTTTPAKLAKPAPYLRTTQAEDGTIALQVAMRQFTSPNKDRPVIWLCGVSHIGDTNYYAAVQNHLDRQPLVLFEGIGGRPRKNQGDPNGLGLQTALARSLNLVFQLNTIDYERSNFRNCDLSIAQLEEIINRQSGGDTMDEFQDMLDLMRGNSWVSIVVNIGLQWIGSDARLQALTRLAMIDLLGSVEGDLSQAGGLPPEVTELLRILIRERNQVVMTDLKKILHQHNAPAGIAIFYGAGHMDDLEHRLTTTLGYQPTATEWLSAFAVNPQRSGVSETEISLVRSLVRWQMRQMKSPK